MKEYIKKNEMFSPGDSILAAVSGGADSMCMLDLLSEYAAEYCKRHNNANMLSFGGRVIAPELPFEIRFLELSDREQEIRMPGENQYVLPGEKDFHIHAFRVNHNVPCYGYAFSLDRAGRFDAARAQARQIPLRLWSRLQKGETIQMEDGALYTPDMVLGPPRKGLRLLYTTDTRPCENIVKYARGADLMICEGMYGEPEKAEKAKEHKHMTFTEAALLARKAAPSELWLTHYSPSLTRPEEYMPAVRNIFPASRAAKDGRTVTLTFENDEN